LSIVIATATDVGDGGTGGGNGGDGGNGGTDGNGNPPAGGEKQQSGNGNPPVGDDRQQSGSKPAPGDAVTKVTVGKDGVPVLSGSPTVAKPLNFAEIPATALTIADKAWTGKQIKSGVSVKMAYKVGGQSVTKTLNPGTDYTVSNPGANKNIGKATITVTGKAGSAYTGAKALTFRIVPKAPSKLKPASAKGALAVKWTKPSKFKTQKITGYQVQYRYKSGTKWTGWKAKSFKVSYKDKAASLKRDIKGLKSGKQYQVRVRAYKKISAGASKGAYYSAWTAAKLAKAQ
jgi:hypothetical protein